MKLRSINLPFWYGIVTCLVVVVCTTILYAFHPEVQTIAENAFRVHQEEGTIHDVNFEASWFLLNVLNAVAQYGIPLLALVSVLFAVWGRSNARRLQRDGARHAFVSPQAAISSPYVLIVVGVVCSLLGWSRLG